jgi:hypothetical protein
MSPPKFGKTTFAASLNEFTKKHLGKETLIIAVEAADGGGVSVIQDLDVPYVQPANYQELDKILAALQTDSTFGGVVIDNASDMVGRIVKPYALTFPTRGQPPPSRAVGVPERGDYQTMGEITRKILNQAINLTKTPNENHRKHLLVTVLQKDRQDQDTGRIVSTQPDLPGAMSDAAAAMFELFCSIKVGHAVVPDPNNPKVTTRQQVRTLQVTGDGVKQLGDRYKLFADGAPLNWTQLMETYWLPKVVANSH